MQIHEIVECGPRICLPLSARRQCLNLAVMLLPRQRNRNPLLEVVVVRARITSRTSPMSLERVVFFWVMSASEKDHKHIRRGRER